MVSVIMLLFFSPRWFKLNSKAGRKEKERGELQVTVQFTRNNMTASMFDLTIKDKPQSAFGKLKDRVTGKKKGDVESSSAIVPGRYAALSGSLGQSFEENSFSGEVGGGGVKDSGDVEISEEKRSKMKDFFKGKLRKSSDTRSCSSLASDSSMSSMASDNPGPPPSLDLMSDPPSSPIYTSKVRVDTHLGETDLAKKGKDLNYSCLYGHTIPHRPVQYFVLHLGPCPFTDSGSLVTGCLLGSGGLVVKDADLGFRFESKNCQVTTEVQMQRSLFVVCSGVLSK